MENFISNRYNDEILPEKYIFPPDKRPGNITIPICNSVPVIDLSKIEGNDRNYVIEEILKASQDFGFFQVINHGVSKTLTDDTMDLFKEFFDMPNEDKASYYSDDPSRRCRLYTSSYNYANEPVHIWRDNLVHPCHPLEDYQQIWPEKPTRYRELVGEYSVEVRKLSFKILELISEGLELEKGYFNGEFTKEQLLSVNHYPPCPNPSLTLGLPKHGDPNLITVLQQGDVFGLQVFKDGQWLGIEPIQNAFVVNIGYQLQIICNGKLKSAEHRAVTNSTRARTTVVTFITPGFETIIQPAKSLISQISPSLYKSFKFKDFVANYKARDAHGKPVLEPYQA